MYRTPARRGSPDTTVVCRACGARAQLALDEARAGTFTCPRCTAEQPTLRPTNDLRPAKTRLVEHHPAKAYTELSAFLAAFDVSDTASQLSIDCDGIHVVVALSLNSGVVQGVDLAAAAPGLPDMTLVRETAVHADAKRRDLVHEVQTGDPAFDQAVYVESPLRDRDAQTVLAAPAVRRAVMRLLESAEKIRLDGGRVEVYFSKERQAFDVDALRERIALVRVLAGAPRPLVAEYAPVSAAATVAKATMYAQAPIGIGLALVATNAYAPVATGPYAIGIAVGLVLALLVHPVFRHALRGRSTSHREILGARVTSMVFIPCMTTGALLIANGTLDRSPERLVPMKVVSTSIDDDDSSKLHVTAIDESGSSHGYTFTPTSPNPGTTVTARWRSGALGWTWESGHATLTSR